LELRSGYYR